MSVVRAATVVEKVVFRRNLLLRILLEDESRQIGWRSPNGLRGEIELA